VPDPCASTTTTAADRGGSGGRALPVTGQWPVGPTVVAVLLVLAGVAVIAMRPRQ
jgi:hypothetical protein